MEDYMELQTSQETENSMDDISKYLPLYLGQKVRTYSGCGILSSIDTDGSWYVSLEKGGGTVGNINDKNQPCPEGSKKTYPPKSILTLILRPLSSMTEEEAIEIGWGSALAFNAWIKAINQSNNKAVFSIYQFKKLLEWGFDIFGLRDKGLALYPEDIK